MRYKFVFELENNRLDIQYRKGIISWIKKSIQEYDEELYQQLYAKKDPIKKSYCFAPMLSQPRFSQEFIELSNTNFTITFSIYNYAYALHLYNAFNLQKNKKFSLNKNSMTLKQIILLPEKNIITDSIKVKMLSPIICRNHDRETRKDMYYCFERQEFETYIRINIAEQMKPEGLDSSLLENFMVEPIEAKKVIISLYEKKIEASLGTFQLTGNPKLLNYLYRAGIGSKKAMGFGLFEIV